MEQESLIVNETVANDFELSVSRDSDAQLQESLAFLRTEIIGGLLYTHSRANSNTNRVLEAASFLYALIELLKEKGLISIEELDQRKVTVGERLQNRFLGKGMGVVIQEPEQDKYALPEKEVRIDCENRTHLCKAACCRLSFPLSMQDLNEGIVKWDLRSPYLISQDAEGYCRHLERATCQCMIRANRPIPCRVYDCRNDQRIWLNFEEKIINPDVEKLFQENQSNPQTKPDDPIRVIS